MKESMKIGEINEMPKAEGLQEGKADVRKGVEGMHEGVADAEEEKKAVERMANRAIQTARWGAIEKLQQTAADKLAEAIVAGDKEGADEIRKQINTLEEQKNKASDRLMGGVEQNTDAMVQ